MGQIYRRTYAGRVAFMFEHSRLQMEHRVVLAALESEMRFTSIRDLLHSYPEAKLQELLAQLRDEGLVQTSA